MTTIISHHNGTYTLSMTYQGRYFWHIVNVSKTKEPLLDKIVRSGMIDVTTLGDILHSGWGRFPPHELVESLN